MIWNRTVMPQERAWSQSTHKLCTLLGYGMKNNSRPWLTFGFTDLHCSFTLSDKISADKIFGEQNFSTDKIFGTKSDFRQFSPPKFCPIRYRTLDSLYLSRSKFGEKIVNLQPKSTVSKALSFSLVRINLNKLSRHIINFYGSQCLK